MMIHHLCTGFHCDKDDPEVISLNKELGIQARLPRLAIGKMKELIG